MTRFINEEEWLHLFLIPENIGSITVNMSGCDGNVNMVKFTFRDNEGKQLDEQKIIDKLKSIVMPGLNEDISDCLVSMAYRHSGSGWESYQGGKVESHYIVGKGGIETKYVDIQWSEECNEEFEDVSV